MLDILISMIRQISSYVVALLNTTKSWLKGLLLEIFANDVLIPRVPESIANEFGYISGAGLFTHIFTMTENCALRVMSKSAYIDQWGEYLLFCAGSPMLILPFYCVPVTFMKANPSDTWLAVTRTK